MKKSIMLFALLLTFSFFSCVEECECDVLDDGSVECPCGN